MRVTILQVVWSPLAQRPLDRESNPTIRYPERVSIPLPGLLLLESDALPTELPEVNVTDSVIPQVFSPIPPPPPFGNLSQWPDLTHQTIRKTIIENVSSSLSLIRATGLTHQHRMAKSLKLCQEKQRQIVQFFCCSLCISVLYL